METSNQNDFMTKILETLERIEKQLAQFAQLFAQYAVAQNKEASSLSPQCPPKDEEKSSKKEEENNPPLSPLFSPEEKFPPLQRAREEAAKEEIIDEAINELESSFAAFWEAYGYKRDRKRAWNVWKNSRKMSKKDREDAMARIEAYKADCKLFERPMCHPSTYLNQRRWEDDFENGFENTIVDIDGKRTERRKRNIITREDYRRREREQRMQDYLEVAAEFRSGSGR